MIVGPTGVGKSDLAIKLAKHYHCSIISADSRQLYRELNIGTAKLSDQEMGGVKHHFINNLSIWEDYDAGKFEKDALKKIEDEFVDTDDIILAGGSGLFIRAVCEGLDEMPPKNS